jgi:hypothetical protein
VELVLSNRRVLGVLEELESGGLVSKRRHRLGEGAYEEGEVRWGIADSLW